MRPLLLFYEEPEHDRWLPLDRYPRRLLRRLMRGKPRPGGQQMVFLNLIKGLDRLGMPYRVNDYRRARRNPREVVGIVGKPHVLYERDWHNPVLFGASVFSHPLACPDLLARHPVRRVLVPGEWMREMFAPYYGDRVRAWPVGIDTDEWAPRSGSRSVDVLLYDKVRWEHDAFEQTLISPVRAALEKRGLTCEELRYGFYEPEQLKQSLARCRFAVFLCEHETQGLAYQQMLASGVPVFAWDRGGYWQDPEFYPDQVRFGPVTSVPYWDERCGMTFKDAPEFDERLDLFLERFAHAAFQPRDYVLEHLTLEACARAYADHLQDVSG
jgi:hypothetical protein